MPATQTLMAAQTTAPGTANADMRPTSQENPTDEGMDFSEPHSAHRQIKDGRNGDGTDLHDAPASMQPNSGDDDEGWRTVLTVRQRKLQARERQQASWSGPGTDKQAQGLSNNHRKPKYRKLPPLPRDDSKVVIRPHQGLPIRTLTSPLLAEAFIAACGNKIHGENFMLRLKPGSNIIIVSTPHQKVAELVRKITSLKVNGRPHAVNAYVATGDGAVRGVIHGLPPHTPSDTLKANLRIRTQNVEIIHARMLGDSKTAVITFYGTFVPKYVYYQGGELACYPYKNTVQVCKICQQVGHRTDVCPQPELHVCKICGTLEPTDGHECTPHCTTCGEDHLTGDRSCRQRLKPARHRPKYQKRKPSPKMQQAPQETDDIHSSRRPWWFEPEEQEMQFSDHEFPGLEHRAHVPRSKSTSRSRSRTRSRSSLRPTKSGMKPPPAPKTNQTHPKSGAVPGQQPAEQP
ncbi:hypothetical protein MTO96_045723, partial [Rhipicephalus appendiculatus]